MVSEGWGNDKDFIGGFLALAYFLIHPIVRVVTTSVKEAHLVVLWGEIGRFIQESKYPLEHNKGGPLIVNERKIRKMSVKTREIEKRSYVLGQVSERGEGMAGHHAPHTLCIIDEASGVDQVVYDMQQGWAKRLLVISNPNPTQNFFYKAVEAGDLLVNPDYVVE